MTRMSVIMTRMSVIMTLTSVITARMSVTYKLNELNLHVLNFNTMRVTLTRTN
jgi:hypothetical protein